MTFSGQCCTRGQVDDPVVPASLKLSETIKTGFSHKLTTYVFTARFIDLFTDELLAIHSTTRF